MAVVRERNQSKQELEELKQYVINSNIPGKIKEVCKYYGEYFSYNGDYVYVHNIETDSDGIRRTLLMEDGDSAGIHMYFYDFDENGKAVRKEQIYDQIFDITKKPERAYLVLCKYMDEWIPIIEKLYSEIDFEKMKNNEIKETLKYMIDKELRLLIASYEESIINAQKEFVYFNNAMKHRNKEMVEKIEKLNDRWKSYNEKITEKTESVNNEVIEALNKIYDNEYVDEQNKNWLKIIMEFINRNDSERDK